MLDVDSPCEGNAPAIAVLEECLAEARKGKVAHACVVLCFGPADVTAKFSGLSGMEMAANYGADLLKKSLSEVLLARMQAPKNPDAPANRVYYDLFRLPVSFDFAGTLINAEMTRIREGAPGPLRVAWYAGPDMSMTKSLDTPIREQFFEGIMRPLVRLIGAVEDATCLDGRGITDCSFVPMVEAFKVGEQMPKFTAPKVYADTIDEFLSEVGQAPVIITLREAPHTPHRNSNLPEWLKFADWLKDQGEGVIILRDTAKSREPLPEHMTCYAASENLLVRMALYEKAKCNLFVSNGPCMLALFSDRPWLMFNTIENDRWYKPGTARGWERFTGVAAGGQFPWSRDDQRIVWQRDTFENIRDAWLAHMSAKAQAAE